MYTNNRDAYRQAFFTAWQKHLRKLPLETVEAQLLKVILLHPEYHALLNNPSMYQAQEFSLEENPFFHMSLHVAIQEQLRLDRPAGVRAAYQKLLNKSKNAHEAEHYMMGCLARVMHKAQESGNMPDEQEYLKELN
jgi:hypothetical protein